MHSQLVPNDIKYINGYTTLLLMDTDRTVLLTLSAAVNLTMITYNSCKMMQ